ncbi:MAG TPA: 5'-nucleotidase, lipoprotein e(P4) family [Pyrinomonadaceae bacterium]|nr:5'-nucleotidase, lipoprotein e(P4) family [Pyrinomonadaceae bacterium]
MKIINHPDVRRKWLRIVLITLTCSFTNFAQTVAPAPSQKQADNVYQEGAVLWTQTSGEARALAYQAFNLARMMLDRDLQFNRRNRMKRAIVVDADETVLDNSRYQATLLKNRQNYDAQTWTEWVKRTEAAAIPGAVEFLRYANSRGVRVFYVTNRNLLEKDATATNLKKLGFPDVSDETLLVRTDAKTSSKEGRRKTVEAKFRIVLLMGDNLNDFAEIFQQSKTVADRLAAVEQNKSRFGRRFIVLPNVMYGDWESAIYDYNFKLTEEEKAAKRKTYLKTY